jgi:hypothetical protein
MLLVPFCAAVYILPFFVSLSVSEDLTKYEAGYFSIVADTVRQNGQLLSRGGRSLPANASAFDTHRDSITSGLVWTQVVDGVWLSYVMLGAALVCMVGLYTSVALTAEISLQVSARPPPRKEETTGLIVTGTAAVTEIPLRFDSIFRRV